MTGGWWWKSHDDSEPTAVLTLELFESLVARHQEQCATAEAAERLVYAEWCAAWER